MTPRGQILVSSTDDDPLPFVCGFKTSPCMPAPRAHVEKHVRELPAYTVTFRMYTRKAFLSLHTGGRRQFCLPRTCARGADARGDVLMYTWGFSACHTTPHAHTTTTPTHTTQHRITHNITRRKRERERHRKRRKRKKTEKEREGKTEEERQDKRRDQKSRQETR